METENKKSETRQRNHRVTIRMDDSEAARAAQLAAENGLSLSAYFRLRGLGEIGERAQRRARPGREKMAELTIALQRLSAEHNKAGSNLNQLARTANTEGFEAIAAGELAAALKDYETAVAELGVMRAAVLRAMGFDV